MNDDDHTYSVWQFLSDGIEEPVRSGVGAEEAVKAARHYTSNVAAKLGMTERVIIVDDDDYCVFEWLKDKGVTFPPEAAGKH